MKGIIFMINRAKRITILALALISLFSIPTWGVEPVKKSKPLETKELMEQFLLQLVSLKKYFVSEDKFVDPKNSIEISSHLKEFADLAKQTKHDPRLNQENFKFSRHVLQDHITDTERVFRLGNKSYARWKLASTVSVCMSCHSQMPAANRSFGEFGNFKIFSSEFDQAEFLFATRAFDKSFELYDKIIDGYPKNKFQPEQVETSLERQLAYFSRIKRDPKEALVRMKAHQKNKELPEYLRRNVAAWISQFENWDKQAVFDLKTATDQQVIDFAKSNIEAKWNSKMMGASNPKLVTFLRVSGVLFEYLQTHPQSKAVPEVLYWLSICDRSINNTVFYSLADLYLRECIVNYPAQPIAKKCYKEFEEETILGYTGSSGTHLPAEVRADLDRLKKLVDTGGKVELREH